MISRTNTRRFVWFGVLIAILFLALDASARGRGGGGRRGGGGFSRGNVSRGGPASGGSMRHSRPSSGGYRGSMGGGGLGSTRPAEVRPDPGTPRRGPGPPGRGPHYYAPGPGPGDRGDRLDRRQDNLNDRQEFRQDVVKERHEFYEDSWKYRNGSSLTVVTFNSLSCTRTTVVVGSVAYTQCGSTWYQHRYVSGSVTYVVVNAPAGY